MVSLIGFLILVNPIDAAYTFGSRFTNTEYKTSLSEAAVLIAQKFYMLHQAHLHILSSSARNDPSTVYLVNEILFRIQGSITYMHWKNIVPDHNKPSSYNMFVIDSYDAFKTIYNKLSYKTIHFDGYFLIVVASSLGTILDSVLERIFEDCYKLYMLNLNVLIRRSDSNLDIIDMYTYFPFVEENCRMMKPVICNSFVNGTFSTNAVIFPSKTKNFHQCPITVVTWHYPPHMILQNFQPGHMEYQGIDGNILHTLVEKMNFSLKFDLSADKRGNVYWNGSATGALGVIINRRGNMTICAHGFMLARPSQIAASVNYFSTGLVFAIPPLGCYTSFEKLFLIFSKTVWCVVLVFYFAAVCIITISKLLSKTCFNFIAGAGNNSPYSKMFSMTTGTPITKPPTRNFARFLFAIWTFAALVIRNSYQGSLFDYLQKSEVRSESPKLMDLLRYGYTLYIPEDCLVWFSELNEFKNHLVVMEKGLWEFFNDMQQPGSQAIVLTTEIQVDYYNHRHPKNRHIMRLEERLFYTPQSIFYPKHSFLVKPIDLILEDCLTGGLINHWIKIFLDEPLPSRTSGHKPISFDDLQGFGFLVLALYFVSIVIFIVEWIGWKVKQLRSYFESLTFQLCLK